MTRLLVLRALGLGDLLVAVPALRGLRAAFPDAEITLAAPAGLAAVAELTGAVDRLLPTAGPTRVEWPSPPPDVAVNLHGRGPESIRAISALRPGRLLTHRHLDFPGLDGPEWTDELREVDRWCGLLAHYGIAADPEDLGLSRPPVRSPAPAAAVVHPGAAYRACRWPKQRYAAVARALADRGRVVVTGSEAERALAEDVAVAAGLPMEAVLAGKTTLSELAAIVADAALVVCGDTGVAHVATAYGTPSVVLFGPASPARWGPPPRLRHRHIVLWQGQEGDPYAERPHPGLLRITTAEVVAATDRLRAGRLGKMANQDMAKEDAASWCAR